MPNQPPELPIVHIYAPRFPHDPIEVIGTRRGLERLIHALIDAVSASRGGGEVCTSDGVASEIRVTCLKGDRRPEEWRRSGSPYWDIDDPLIARILDLSEQASRLRQVVAVLRRERKQNIEVEYLGDSAVADAGLLPAD